MDKIEKIRTKIDRMLDDICDADGLVQKSTNRDMMHLQRFLTSFTLWKKNPTRVWRGEIRRYLREECSSDDEPATSETARHFAEWGAEHAIE